MSGSVARLPARSFRTLEKSVSRNVSVSSGFIESRRIAAEQAVVTNLLTAVSKRADVSGSELYSSSNEEMLAASDLASQDLSSSSVSRRTVMVQKEVEASIAALMEALSDPPEAEDPFAHQIGDLLVDSGGVAEIHVTPGSGSGSPRSAARR